MMCLERAGTLVVAQGTSEPVEHEIEFDDDYAAEMMRRAEAFLHSMRTLTPPYPEPPIYPPEKWRTIDVMAEPTNWSAQLLDHLTDFGETAEARGCTSSRARPRSDPRRRWQMLCRRLDHHPKPKGRSRHHQRRAT